MNNRNTFIVILAIIVAAAAIVYFVKPEVFMPASTSKEPTQEIPSGVVCTMDAKICPDGSAVGRTGPNCEFAACPTPAATSSTVTVPIGGSVTALGVTIEPRQIASDSRCPNDVQCVWAGTVEVKAALSTAVSHGDLTFKLGEEARYGDVLITLVNVSPARLNNQLIATSSYRLTFDMKKR